MRTHLVAEIQYTMIDHDNIIWRGQVRIGVADPIRSLLEAEQLLHSNGVLGAKALRVKIFRKY